MDQEMKSVTPYSNWELLNINHNPNDRLICCILTAAGLLELSEIFELVEIFAKGAKLSECVKNIVLNIYRRGAYLHEIKLFYKDLGINYVNQFESKKDLMAYCYRDVESGEKKKFALGFYYDEHIQTSTSPGFNQSAHIVALKLDKSRAEAIFRTIDFQLPREERVVKNDLPTHAKPPFHLFEKLIYR